MKKNDFIAALAIGTGVGFLAQPVIDNIYRGSSSLAFVFGAGGLTPVLRAGLVFFFAFSTPFALWILSFVGRLWPVVYQFAKFATIGTLNSVLSSGVVNILSLASGITRGVWIPVFATAAFIASTTNSFFWNKYWTFGASGGPRAGETVKFYIIAGIGWALNVSAVSIVVNYAHPQSISPQVWLNVGELAGIAASFIWNFLGYKYLVFKQSENIGQIASGEN